MAISAGPYFKLNPSISCIVNFDPSRDTNAREMLNEVWNKLSDGGTPLMPLGRYPFSEWYGWIQDKYGFTWQLMLTNPEGEPRPAIVPSLMFTGDNCGKAEEAREFYLSVFRNAKPGTIVKSSMVPDKSRTGRGRSCSPILCWKIPGLQRWTVRMLMGSASPKRFPLW
nr:VOC family protein [Paenibacillus sp. J14]